MFVLLLFLALVSIAKAGITGGACHVIEIEGSSSHRDVVQEDFTSHELNMNLNSQLECFHQGFLGEAQRVNVPLTSECMLDFRFCPNAVYSFNLDPSYYNPKITSAVNPSECQTFKGWGKIFVNHFRP
jgi:hypothetical protein